MIVDVTAILIQRTKKQKKAIGVEKFHTFKVQVLIYYKTQQILSLYMSKSTVHDLELFKWNLNLIPTQAFILPYKIYKRFMLFIQTVYCHQKQKDIMN